MTPFPGKVSRIATATRDALHAIGVEWTIERARIIAQALDCDVAQALRIMVTRSQTVAHARITARVPVAHQ